MLIPAGNVSYNNLKTYAVRLFSTVLETRRTLLYYQLQKLETMLSETDDNIQNQTRLLFQLYHYFKQQEPTSCLN